MERFSKALFSMRSMAVAMIIFLVAIAAATFIESAYDVQAAKILIYNALWFEILLLFLSINLIANIFRYKMFRREKIAMLSFHLSFLIIILGAGVTRYFSFEGLMIIREGESSNVIYSSDPYLWFKINDGKLQYTYSEKMFMSEITNNYFEIPVEFPNHNNPINIEYVNFQKKMIDSLVINDSINGMALEIITDGMRPNFLCKNDFLMIGDIAVSFEKKDAMPGVQLTEKSGRIFMTSSFPVSYLPMSEMKKARQEGTVSDSLFEKVAPGQEVQLQTTTLYRVGNQQIVLKSIIQHAKRMLVPSGKRKDYPDYLTLKVTDGQASKIVQLPGGMGQIPEHVVFELNGLTYEMEYGSTKIELPFYVKCNDFQLENYPGTQAPSSFASEVSIIDKENDYSRDQRIFMNHVMDYRGYRFFQSDFILDNPATPENEEATILSVNADWWGTNITYLGYLLMAIGMILSLFSSSGRFRDLHEKIKKSKLKKEKLLPTILLLIGLFGSTNGFAQQHDPHDGHNHSREENAAFSKQVIISKEHSEMLASLLVQIPPGPDQRDQGRIVPLHTLCLNLLRKVYKNDTYQDLNAVQTIMSLNLSPHNTWEKDKIIQVPYALRDELDLGTYASINDLSNNKEEFKWDKEYLIAFQKLESKRNEFDKNLLKLFERYTITKLCRRGFYLKLIPLKGESNNTWYGPLDTLLLKNDPVGFNIMIDYFNEVYSAVQSNNYSSANQKLEELKKLQRNNASDIVPSELSVKLEIAYNNLNIFKTINYVYLTVGFLLLVIFFINIFVKSKPRKLEDLKNADSSYPMLNRLILIGFYLVLVAIIVINIVIPSNAFLIRLINYLVLTSVFLLYAFLNRKSGPNHNSFLNFLYHLFNIVILAAFIYHGIGLGIRWYISGHAPWSNGYEAVIFIAWVTMIAGLVFSRKNAAVLGGTAILAGLMIWVTQMNLLDPEITPLQPVLKSYWLMIHVAIITGSYGFLGMSAILGFLNLVLYIFRNQKNNQIVSLNINEISYISEMSMTIGLFMLTIGTFLGGIWANESWGRYWGWDPKETWALVSVLVYAVILHLRFIPGLSGKFLFNVVSFWGYSAILFTFFGVNFYLVGLHSYAQGEGLGSIPSWLIITVIIFALFTILSGLMNKIFMKKNRFQEQNNSQND